VQTDQARKIVLVVGKTGDVAARAVELGPVVDGLRIVRAGIAPSDRVIITGGQFAPPGAKVQAKVGQIKPVAPGALPAGPAPAGQATFAR
jgi:hypothetical protein